MSAVLSPQPLLRKEDQRLITGTGQFTSDAWEQGTLHAVMVRSDHAHARFKADWSAVRQAPGVRCVLTAQDVTAAGFAALVNAVTVKDAQGQPQVICRMPVLAQAKVLYVGQPMAMVIADTAELAANAAEMAEIDYETLPCAVTFEDATAPGAVQLHEEAPGNTSVVFEAGDRAAVDAAFARAAMTSNVKVVSQRLIPAPMEPRAVQVWHDAATGLTHVRTPTQGLVSMLGMFTTITGWPADSIRIHTQDVGGSFGLRGTATSEHVLLMLAARTLGRPVRWVSSRSETFLSDWHGRALTLHGHIALDAQGRILAIRFDNQVDAGAFNVYFSTHIGARNLSITMGGVYKVPALHMRSHIYYTNTVPVSAYRGAGRPDLAYAIERLVDHAAHEHGLDPVAIRRLNFIPPADFPYTTANGTVYDNGQFERIMDCALTDSDAAGVAQRRERARSRGRLFGRGLAYYLESSGPGAAAKDQVRGRIEAGGLTLHAISGASGQGHETSFARIVERELGLPSQRVRFVAGEVGRDLVGNSTGGSRTLYGLGSAIVDLCRQLMEHGRPQVAQLWGCTPEELVIEGGHWRHAGREMGFEAWLDQAGAEGLELIGQASSGATFPNGCHIAEVEIDPQTGVCDLVGYWAADDVGEVISPKQLIGQVHGGVVQGLGQAFGEHAVYDRETGQLLSGSFMDYAMPRAGILHGFHHQSVPVPTKLNMLGAKGVGESGCSGSLPALANAVVDALRPLGINQADMPFSPARLWDLMQSARS
jgi:carbon-monoxide dehydrogenase large subunit